MSDKRGGPVGLGPMDGLPVLTFTPGASSRSLPTVGLPCGRAGRARRAVAMARVGFGVAVA